MTTVTTEASCLASPLVWVVVLNWNGLEDTLECLGSLSRLCYPNVQIVVVDNGSRANDVDRIRELFSHALVLRNPENLGYAGGNNTGIRLALRNGADYVWLLNNDTVVDPECLTQLIAVGETHPRVGLLSPVIYDYDRPRNVQFCGTILDWRAQRQITLTSLADRGIRADTAPLTLWGTALLLRRTLAEAIGLFDERYFAYHEDLDYSVRAIKAGFDTRLVPEAAVFHKSGRSLGTDSPLKEYLVVRNWYMLWRSHLTGRQRRAYRRRFLVWAMDRVIRAKNAGKRALAEHSLDGIWDAFRGRCGSWETKREMPKPLKRLLLDGLLAWHPYFWLRLLSGGLRQRRGQARESGDPRVEVK
jgi:GT2 family glycosyltransferase